MGDPRASDSNPFRWFERSVRSRKIRDASRLEALARVDRAIASAGLRYPRVDLHQLAAHLQIREVRSVPLATEARVVTTQLGDTTIELNDSLPPFERHFALAHELAHVILGHRPTDVTYHQFEETCDTCAREILLPDDFLRDSFTPTVDPPTAVSLLSHDSGLPPDFILLRALDAAAIPRLEVYWCEVRAGRFTAIRSLPQKYPHELTDIRIHEQRPYPLTQAVKTMDLTSGEVLISEAGGPELRRRVSCIPLIAQRLLLILDSAPSGYS